MRIGIDPVAAAMRFERKLVKVPCALAIGGVDPGGGAGLFADLRAFALAGAFGAGAAAVLTVQSTSGLRAAHAMPTRHLRAQIDEVLRHQRVGAIKTGALGDAANVRLVAQLAARHPGIPVVVDPVMIPTRGKSRLLATSALRALVEDLLPRATLVTANANEAEALVNARIRSVQDAVAVAERICELGPRAALVKGGHVPAGRGAREIVDVLCAGGRVQLLSAKRLPLPPIHGGGCALASLIAGRLAVLGVAGGDAREDVAALRRIDSAVVAAVRWARRAHHRLLTRPLDVGGALAVLASLRT